MSVTTGKLIVGTPVEVRGTVDSVVFAKEGFAVCRLGIDENKATEFHPKLVNSKFQITISGKGLDTLSPGQVVSVSGEVMVHQHYGPQVSVGHYVVDTPKSQREMAVFLEKHIPSVGKVIARRIVDAHGVAALDVIDKNPDDLLKIKGITQGKIDEIKRAWIGVQDERALILFFIGLDIPTRFIKPCIKEYGEQLVPKIREDPYRLARDITGIGWSIADGAAFKLGVEELSEVRITAACIHVVQDQQQQGHCFMLHQQLVEKVMVHLALPNIDRAFVTACIKKAIEKRHLLDDDGRIYRPLLFINETLAALRLLEIKRCGPPPELSNRSRVEKAFLDAIADSPVLLDDSQKMAVWQTLNSKVSVITGRPGTGKTTVTKTLVRAYQKCEVPILLLAPTGRAAARMREVIGLNASTIHLRLVKMPGEEPEPIRGVVIVDEHSMTDINLMSRLMGLMEDDAVLVFIGDMDQLPSVGPGAVLRDMIQSGTFTVSALTKIYRQAAMSDIIVNAHSINNGMLVKPNLAGRQHGGFIGNSDYYTCLIEDLPKQLEALTYLTKTYLPYRGFNPATDLQVLSPGHESLVGVGNLNLHMQALLNPHPVDAYSPFEGVRWGVGDRVMNVKNTYKLGLTNGDQGVIQEILRHDDGNIKALRIKFDTDTVDMERHYFSQLYLSYASTIHKMQGSESPVVIFMVSTSHYTLLERALFYTGFTRARKLLIVIAQQRALMMCLGRNLAIRRNTWLAERLRMPLQEQARLRGIFNQE